MSAEYENLSTERVTVGTWYILGPSRDDLAEVCTMMVLGQLGGKQVALCLASFPMSADNFNPCKVQVFE